MTKTLRGLFLVLVSVIILCTNSSQAAVSSVDNSSLKLLASGAVAEEDFLMFGTLEKITDEEDPDYNYYRVTAVLTRKARAANLFKAIIAMWTADGERVDLLDFEPCSQGPGFTAFTIAIPGFSIDFSSDSPGPWSVESTEVRQGDFMCYKVDWEMVFELWYYWQHLEVTSLWRVPEGIEVVAEVQTYLATADGSRFTKSTNFDIRSTEPLRFPILEAEKSAP